MGKKVSPTLVGTFVIGALALVIAGVAVFGSGRLFRKTQEFVAYFDRSVNGLRVGAPVKFKGVEIGAVTKIRLSLSHRMRDPKDVRIPVIIELDADRLSEQGADVNLTPEALDEGINRGLRAQLSTESFVTGVLYVELDFHPGSPVHLMHEPEATILEIPTLPTALEQVQSKASEIINKLSEVDFRHLIDSATQTVEGMNALVNSPELKAALSHLDGAVNGVHDAAAGVRDLTTTLQTDVRPAVKSLRATADQAEATLAGLRVQLEPGAPLFYQLSHTLTDLSEAARALRALADALERNPSALVRGKPSEEHR